MSTSTTSAAESAVPGLAGPLATARFAVIDVETSGLSSSRHRVLQIAVVQVSGDGTVESRWDTLLRAPWRPLGARRIHGHTAHRVADAGAGAGKNRHGGCCCHVISSYILADGCTGGTLQ